jgi:hypothetical protein
MSRSEQLRRKRQALANFEDTKNSAKEAIKRLKREIAELEAKPTLSPPPFNATITFYKQFEIGGKNYRYAALYADGYWYLTGAYSPQRITWDELADFIEKDNLFPVEYAYAVQTKNVVAR